MGIFVSLLIRYLQSVIFEKLLSGYGPPAHFSTVFRENRKWTRIRRVPSAPDCNPSREGFTSGHEECHAAERGEHSGYRYGVEALGPLLLVVAAATRAS